MNDYCRAVCGACSLILLGAQLTASPPVRQKPTDPRITTELVVAKDKDRIEAGQPIIVDVYVTNSTSEDIRENQFSPLSSSVGLPDFTIVSVASGQRVSISPGFAEARDWDSWYQPSRRAGAGETGAFILPAGQRIHLLHGDLRLTIEHAWKHCQRILAERSGPIERPDMAGTRKYYEDIVRFSQLFRRGGVYELTVWAYARSNTITLGIEPSAR